MHYVKGNGHSGFGFFSSVSFMSEVENLETFIRKFYQNVLLKYIAEIWNEMLFFLEILIKQLIFVTGSSLSGYEIYLSQPEEDVND